MALASVALNFARSLLNDVIASAWPDSLLLPFMQEAHRELQVNLELAGIPVINAVTAVLSVPTNTTDLTTVTNYPTDLIKPEWMKERTVGQQLQDFVDMTEVDFIPDIQQSTELIWWAWIGEKILLLGATNPVEVQLRYWRGLPPIIDQNSQIGFIFGENYLGYRTAELAAGTTGNESGVQDWSAKAEVAFDRIKRMNIRGLQNLPAKRRPYHRGRGRSRVLRDF